MNPDTFHWFLIGAAGIYGVAALLVLGRMIAGPNSMDRLVSLESLIAMIQGMFAAYIAWSDDTSWAYPMLVVALLGFISSLSVARFRVADTTIDAARRGPGGRPVSDERGATKVAPDRKEQAR